jgi:choline-sulfatase
MRILYIDIDSLRPDHLSCYGYHRNTSPVIDKIAAQGVRFSNYYVSDSPCLPSRTAMWSGRFGFHNGVINHGGAASEMFNEGPGRGFESTLGLTGWMRCLRRQGMKTVTISPFGERHSAWHWYANFNEIYNTGGCGLERADEVAPVAIDWIQRCGKQDDWFLHLNLWDPHTPYRTPKSFGNPFADQPIPTWLTEEVRAQHWQECGPHSAQEVNGYDNASTTFAGDFPMQPTVMDSMDDVRLMFDGYDCGTRYADDFIGQILDSLAQQGVLDQTAIIITADHGENLGELNIYGDHQTADHITARVPLIIRWPGVTDAQAGRVDDALHYHMDFAATTIELTGGTVPDNWDGRAFTKSLQAGESEGRDYLVLSQGAWCCQRAVRFKGPAGQDLICIRSYHDAYHAYRQVMLFDLNNDPHEQHNLADEHPDWVASADALLNQWHQQMMETATTKIDPMDTVLAEGGPLHARGQLPAYLKRLEQTGRSQWAQALVKQYPDHVSP